MRAVMTTFLVAGLLACGGETPPAGTSEPAKVARTMIVRDTVVESTFDAPGLAEPVERAILSTKLMGSVTRVLVQEGDRVGRGALMAQIDARDVNAKRVQVEASVRAAEAVHQDAMVQAARFRALYADSAATRYQLEQAETGLARAEAGLNAARAAGAEVAAVEDYAEIRAPFPGLVTRRYADPGAFVAPGAPVVEVQRDDRLRLSATLPPSAARGLRAGLVLQASVEGREVLATIEGVVPAPAGAVYTVNAIVPNSAGALLAGSAATLRVPQGQRRTILLPTTAIHREGDLTGVRIQTPAGSELRFVKLADGATPGAGLVEVLSGLRVGDVLLMEGD